MAYRIPAGSKFIFQMHYTPNGLARDDMTHVGFKFADSTQVREEASARRAINVMMQIPPGAANYEARADYHFDRNAMLIKMIPHMHVRGKSFRYEATYPDGRREVLLDVPRWDFNWQMEYVLTEPKVMPAGTRLNCTAVYDNSDQNQANPDSKAWVTFGEQTWQEMLIGFFVAAEPGQIEEPPQVNELAHIISNGIVEANKQTLLKEDEANPLLQGVRSDRFLKNSTKVLGELSRGSRMHVTKVQPVRWPPAEKHQ
jgi:hypothetical protein